jgi:hypothetical protein
MQEESAAEAGHTFTERVSVAGGDLIKTVQALLREAAVRKITVQDKNGRTLVEIPLYAGVAGALILGSATVLALIAAWFAEVSILIERDKTFDDGSPTVVGEAVERAAGQASQVVGSVSAFFGSATRGASDAARRMADSLEARLNQTPAAETVVEGEVVEAAAEPQQCAATTKAGARCKRPAMAGSDYCSLHQIA